MDFRKQRHPAAVCRGVALVMLLLAMSAGACAPEEEKEESKHLNVTVTGDVSNLALTRAVVVLHVAATSCAGSATSGPRHTADKDITAPGGPVTLSFTLSSGKYPKAYAETYFIDVDNSNHLNNGDLVWGTDPMSLAGGCFDTIKGRPTNDSLDWEDIASLFGGFTSWGGGAQTFSTQDEDVDEDLSNVSMSVVPLERSFSELVR